MTPENAEVVRRVVQALLEGDFDDAAFHLDPGAEWRNTDAFPGPRICTGPEEIKAFWAALFDDFSRGGMEIEAMVESGDTVVASIHSWGSGRASGAPVDVRWAGIYRLRGGKITRCDIFGDYENALAVAGLQAP